MKYFLFLVTLFTASCAQISKPHLLESTPDENGTFKSEPQTLVQDKLTSYYPVFDLDTSLEIHRQVFFMIANGYEQNNDLETAFNAYYSLLNTARNEENARYLVYKMKRITKLGESFIKLEQDEAMTIDEAFMFSRIENMKKEEDRDQIKLAKAKKIIKKYYEAMHKFYSHTLLEKKEKEKIFNTPLSSW